MPRGDGTGPGGFGPMTGRGAGYCAGYSVPGAMNPTAGRGQGMGRGLGRGGWGRRGGFFATGMPPWQRANYGYPPVSPEYGYSPSAFNMTNEQERDMLKNQAEALNQTLSEINQRIEALAADKKKS